MSDPPTFRPQRFFVLENESTGKQFVTWDSMPWLPWWKRYYGNGVRVVGIWREKDPAWAARRGLG